MAIQVSLPKDKHGQANSVSYLPVQTEKNNEIIYSLINMDERTLIRLIFFLSSHIKAAHC